MMKRIMIVLAAAVIASGMLLMTSCSKSSFSMAGESEKLINVEAENASEDSASELGGFDVGENEQITMTSDLEKGTIRIEIYKGPDEQSAEELPEKEGDPVMTFNASGTEMLSGTVEPGYYFITAKVTEKATGKVEIKAETRK